MSWWMILLIIVIGLYFQINILLTGIVCAAAIKIKDNEITRGDWRFRAILKGILLSIPILLIGKLKGRF